MRQSLFPPTEEEAKKANLHYTLRILPHQQNTGGFYIAVLVKKDKLPPLVRNPNSNYNRNNNNAGDAAAQEDASASASAPQENASAAQETSSASAPAVAAAPSEPAQAPAQDSEDVPLPETAEDVAAEKAAEAEVEDGPKRNVKERTWVEEPFIPLSPEMRDILLYLFLLIL